MFDMIWKRQIVNTVKYSISLNQVGVEIFKATLQNSCYEMCSVSSKGRNIRLTGISLLKIMIAGILTSE